MAPVKFSDLLNGFESASFGGSLENMEYIGLDAGEVHLVSGEIELEDKVPDDIDTSDRHLAIPHKREFPVVAPASRNQAIFGPAMPA